MKFLYKKHSYPPPPPPPHSKKAGYFNNLRTFIHAFSKISACLLKGWRVQTGAGVLRNISQSICKKGVQKLKHAFCHTRVLQTRCAQSRTRFEPPFHKIIHIFIPSFPRKRESSSRKAGLFTSTCFRLKSCFRFTLSRVRNWSRVAIPSPVGGFGLVETLVVAGVSLTLGYGIIKTSLVGMQTNAIVHTSLKEQDLIHTVRTTLGDETQCKYNLKPSELTTAGTPPKTTISAIKNTGPTTATTDDIPLITAGQNFKNNPLIHVQQMELSGTGSDRTFTLYYKKPQLGSLSSPGTCTDLDPSGCYFIACKMDYDCSTDADCSPTGSGVCNPRNCAEGGAVAGVDTAQVTAIITEQLKKKNCSDDSGTTKVLKGFKETTGQLDIDCEPLPAQQQIQGCEAGEVLQGFKDNGDSICVPQCSAGRTVFEKIRFQWKPWYPIPPDINNPSESDKGTITYEVGTSSDYLNFLLSDNCSFLHTDSTEPCITVLEESRVCQCPSGKKWVQADSKCMTCTGSGFYWQPVSNGYQCRCSGGVKKKTAKTQAIYVVVAIQTKDM